MQIIGTVINLNLTENGGTATIRENGVFTPPAAPKMATISFPAADVPVVATAFGTTVTVTIS